MTLRTLELLSFWAGAAAVVFAALSAVAGIGAWHFSNRVGAVKEVAANERARSLELRIAEQQERAATAEKALLELQERAKPRTVAPPEREAILSILKQHVPKEPIEITFIGGSVTEPGPFAHTIADLLTEAGWTVSQIDGGPSLGTPPTGLFIRVSDSTEIPFRAALLERALAAGKVGVRIVRVATIKPEEVELLVGLKP